MHVILSFLDSKSKWSGGRQRISQMWSSLPGPRCMLRFGCMQWRHTASWRWEHTNSHKAQVKGKKLSSLLAFFQWLVTIAHWSSFYAMCHGWVIKEWVFTTSCSVTLCSSVMLSGMSQCLMHHKTSLSMPFFSSNLLTSILSCNELIPHANC